MAVRRCIPWPDPRLRQKAAPVSEITNDIRAIWQDMVDTMEDMTGVGLAAPQIGEMLRLAVVDASVARGQVILMANPEILQSSKDLYEFYEASPNLSGQAAKIRRPKTISVQFLNADSILEQDDFQDLWSTSVQHQVDHLNGKMFFDNLSKVRRDMLLRKARKAK
jgi:peptide deformylase